MDENSGTPKRTGNDESGESNRTNDIPRPKLVATWGDWVNNLIPEELKFLTQQDAEDEKKFGPVFDY